MEINTHAQVESAPSQNMGTGALVCVETVACVGHLCVVTVVCTGGAWNMINAVQTTASSVQSVLFLPLGLAVLGTDVKYSYMAMCNITSMLECLLVITYHLVLCS